MKNLIKLLVLVFALTLTANSFAQVVGVKAGLNLSSMLSKDDEATYSDDFKLKPGFHAGVTAEFPITEMVSFETGLLLSTKGFKASEEETLFDQTEKYESTVSLFYLDVPLMARSLYDLGGVTVYGALGPYIGIGLSGKEKYEYTSGGETESEEYDIEWGSDEEDHLKRLDFGLAVGAGVEMNALVVGLSYQYGLANIAADTSDGNKLSNRVLGVSVGYKFGGE